MRILDAHVSIEETTELGRPEVDRPDPIINFFEAHVLLGDRLARISHTT
jgi:hypothetical protein